ncbi:MAG: DUF3616 domain-containing protein [Chitinophagaceae bacterium]|nr:DUF3616 domain-containing protein [Chitinophagaceae bacterium]
MKYFIKTSIHIIVLFIVPLQCFAQDICMPVGWATQNGGVTGGGNAAATVVSSYTSLKTAITSSSVKVVYISGVITIPSGGKISFQDQTGKTVFGLPGSRLISADLTAAGSGILYVKRCTDIILRNITFEGPGAYDTDGNDNLTIENCTRVWIDHCEFQDGMDGNLDIKTASDFVSVTWCKFIYNKAPIPGGPGGSNDHRFSNLLGSSDDATDDRTKLNITFQYCWWAQGCKARMPRVRFGKVHLANNYFNSAVSSQCVQAGFEANLLIESNVFENVHTPIDPMANNFTAITARNNIFTNTTGNTAGSGIAFTPPYTLTITPAANVKGIVSNPACGAGATLSSPTACGCGVYALTTAVLPINSGIVSKNPDAALYAPDSIVTVTATPIAGYEFVNWIGDAVGNDTVVTVTMTASKNVTANFQQIVSPTLTADAAQPSYPVTNKPFLTIAAGSGKTSYVSGVINHPADPAATKGIVFTVSSTSAVLQVTSSNTSVVPVSNIIITKANGKFVVKIIPAAAGYSTINLVANNTAGNSSTYKINFAASAASANPPGTFFHTNSSDASGASSVDSNYMFVADDENNFIRLYNKHYSGKELYSLDVSSAVGASAECDLEGSSSSVKFNAGKRLYWIGSLGNNKSGALKADRNKVIATEVSGDSSNATLSVKSYSNQFRNALINWGDAQGWGFTTSAASGMIPKRIDGFNVEGLTIAKGGDTAYIGFRAPCVPVKGVTPTASNRKYAIIAPVNNFETILNSNGQVSTTPATGEPILFDLDGLGIRSLERAGNGNYLIVAGLYTGGGSPAVYLWDGVVPFNSGQTPITTNSPVSKLIKLNLAGLQDLAQTSADGALEGHPEALMVDAAGNEMQIALISDDGTLDYYNDGTEAKDLPHDEFKKYRSDKFTISTDTVYGPVINLCPGYTNTQLSSDLNGAAYSWQWDTCGNGCYAAITDNSNFSGVATKYLSITNMPTSWNGYHFRCVTDGNNSNTYTIKFSLNWTGAVNNNWETAGNWDCNHLPDENTDVYIEKGMPALHSNAAIRSISISNAANLTITSGNNLTTLH